MTKRERRESLHISTSVKNLYCIGAKAMLDAAFGEGSGPVLLSQVRCTGWEYRLFNCTNRKLEIVNCLHSRDAGVVCTQGTYGYSNCIIMLSISQLEL